MDPVSVSAITSLVVVYAKHLAGVAGAALDGLLEDTLKETWTAIRDRFRRDDQATGALDRLERDPDNKRRQAAFEDHLEELMAADPAFRDRLAELWSRAQTARTVSGVQVTDAGAVAVGGDVAIHAGSNAAGRDLTVSYQPVSPPSEP